MNQGKNALGCTRAPQLAKILLMTIEINGEPRNFESVLTLSSLLEQLGMKSDRVAVELNRAIVPRDRWPETQIADGDRLEIVHFVGGGHDSSLAQLPGTFPGSPQHTS
jgi:thiamine biosynthesis protein ThiS